MRRGALPRRLGNTDGGIVQCTPVIVLPLGADQPDNGDRVQDLGCGIVLDPHTATPTTIAAAIAAVHDNSEYRRQAAHLTAEAAAQPALHLVTRLRDLLESLSETDGGRRVEHRYR